MILFRDDHLLVVNKPAGLPVLPDGWQPDAPWLVRLLESEHGKIWVVHRLDKVTSGVLLFARTAEAHRALNRAFETRDVHKTYHALVNGVPRWDERTARHPLRANVGHRHRTVVDREGGQPAITHLRLLRRFADGALMEAVPETGRTHQIRAHLAALGHPLLADELYGAPPSGLIARPALHAFAISFAHPASGEMLTFEAPYPEDFARALAALSD